MSDRQLLRGESAVEYVTKTVVCVHKFVSASHTIHLFFPLWRNSPKPARTAPFLRFPDHTVVKINTGQMNYGTNCLDKHMKIRKA
jgi:hypothetical protein